MPPAAVLLESFLDLAPPRLDETLSPVASHATTPSAGVIRQKRDEDQLLPRNRYIGRPEPFATGARALANGAGAVQLSSAASLHKRSSSLAPNYSQKVTLGVIAVYVVVISVLWVTPVVKWVLWPFKVSLAFAVVRHATTPVPLTFSPFVQMLVVAWHEFSHAATGCCTGAKIKSISLDPREGGVTMMAGGISAITLPAGYLGSVSS